MDSIAPAPAKSILVIEDDELISALLLRILEREGYHVQVAPNGAVAQGIIQSEQAVADLVLLDLSLPYVDGLTLLDTLMKTPRWKHTHVVILSGKTQEDQISKALALGAEDYVTKPFQIGELLARVHRIFIKR